MKILFYLPSCESKTGRKVNQTLFRLICAFSTNEYIIYAYICGQVGRKFEPPDVF